MRFAKQAESLERKGYEWAVTCGQLYDLSFIPDQLQGTLNQSSRLGEHRILAAARGRLLSYAQRGIIEYSTIEFPKPGGLVLDDRRSIHFILSRHNTLVGSIRGTMHRGDVNNGALCCRHILERADLPNANKPLVDRVMEVAGSHEFVFEVSSWYVNPRMKSERVFAVLLPAMMWAFTSLFTNPFSAFAFARASNGAGSMLEKLGGIPVPGFKFDDRFYKGNVILLGMRSHQFNPVIDDLVLYLQEVLQRTLIDVIAANAR